jgi:hypothetical protein
MKLDRRVVLTGGAIAAVVLPAKWTKPIIKQIVVPAHAQTTMMNTTRPPVTLTMPPSTGTTTPPQCNPNNLDDGICCETEIFTSPDCAVPTDL